MGIDTAKLKAAVQGNCHISDARYAGDYTLCIYLLKMREYYRWEQQQGFAEPIAQDEVGEWLRRRESLWEDLEDQPFARLPVNGDSLDPFESEAVNQSLSAEGLIYSAGLGNRSKPLFFLADLESRRDLGDYRIFISGREHARDLTAPPAMSQGKDIFIRRESLRRMIWEKVDEARWHQRESALTRAMAAYDFEHQLEQSLDEMTEHEVNSALRHEIGEVMAGEQLGPAWEDMLATMPRSGTEFMIRAVRDLLADCLSTLPALLQDSSDSRLHFFFANLSAMRKEIAPGLQAAYEDWLASGRRSALEDQVRWGKPHWLDLAADILALYQCQGNEAIPQLTALIESRHL